MVLPYLLILCAVVEVYSPYAYSLGFSASLGICRALSKKEQIGCLYQSRDLKEASKPGISREMNGSIYRVHVSG